MTQTTILTRKRYKFRDRLRHTRGAIDLASIMVGVLIIGIVGGVIAATVFAVIPWAQDQAAKQNLDAVKVAESVSYAQSAGTGTGGYSSYSALIAAHSVQSSKTVDAIPTDAGQSYLAASRSASGKIAFAGSEQTEVRLFASIDAFNGAGLGASATYSPEAGLKLAAAGPTVTLIIDDNYVEAGAGHSFVVQLDGMSIGDHEISYYCAGNLRGTHVFQADASSLRINSWDTGEGCAVDAYVIVDGVKSNVEDYAYYPGGAA